MAKDKTGSITTHIDHEHEQPNIFHHGSAVKHPKASEGCYANAEGRNSSNMSMHNKD